MPGTGGISPEIVPHPGARDLSSLPREHIHAIFAGHYHSESYGVQSLAGLLARETGLVTTYLDIPTGL